MEISSWMGEVAASIIIGTVALLFPYKPKEYISPLHKSELVAKYQKWDWISLPLLFTMVPLMTWIFGQIFIAQYQWEIDHNPRILYQILPGPDAWYIPGCMVAFALIELPLNWFYRLALKDKYAEYELYGNLTHNYAAKKVWRPMAWLLGVAALVAIYFINDYYVKIWSFKIEVNELVGTEVKNYNFDQIKRITYVEYSSSGREDNVLEEDPHYLAQFKDKYTWNAHPGWTNMGRNPEFIKFLSQRSGIKIDTIGVEGLEQAAR